MSRPSVWCVRGKEEALPRAYSPGEISRLASEDMSSLLTLLVYLQEKLCCHVWASRERMREKGKVALMQPNSQRKREREKEESNGIVCLFACLHSLSHFFHPLQIDRFHTHRVPFFHHFLSLFLILTLCATFSGLLPACSTQHSNTNEAQIRKRRHTHTHTKGKLQRAQRAIHKVNI